MNIISNLSWISWIIFGALAGWGARILTGRNSREGCVGNIIVGIIGAFLGGWGYSLFTGRPLVVGGDWTAFIVAAPWAPGLLSLVKRLAPFAQKRKIRVPEKKRTLKPLCVMHFGSSVNDKHHDLGQMSALP